MAFEAETFRIKPEGGRFYFVVFVFETKKDLKGEYDAYQLRIGANLRQDDFGAIFKPYEVIDAKTGAHKDNIGSIFFSKEQLGVGTIAHEIGHAAFWYDRLVNGNANAEYGEEIGEAEERVLYLLSEMVKDCINKMYKLKIL